jgi:hypothetical protein
MSKHKSKKDKKSKGHIQARLTITKKEALENNLEPLIFWDDWKDYRDSFRAWYDDRSKIHKITYRYQPYDIVKNNSKIKLKEQIRKLRKGKVVL